MQNCTMYDVTKNSVFIQELSLILYMRSLGDTILDSALSTRTPKQVTEFPLPLHTDYSCYIPACD